MSAFWENFADANGVAVEAMGETITLDGVEVSGVVSEPMGIEEGAAAGGRKTIIGCRVLIAAEVALRDGMPVTVRGAAGRVNSWGKLGPGAGVMVEIGPVNRWSGDVPGV